MSTSIVGRYKIESMNGAAVRESAMTIQFSDAGTTGKVRVHAMCANVMNGRLSHTNGVLKGMVMSTMMMGPPELMEAERILTSSFAEGMGVQRDGDDLTLTSRDLSNVLVYRTEE